MTSKNKKLTQKHIIALSNMSISEVINFAREWYMAEVDLDREVFKQVKETIIIVEEHLKKAPIYSAMAEDSELKEGDRGDLI